MKILLPYVAKFGPSSSIYNENTVIGGLELFCKLIYQNIPNVIPVEIYPEDQKKRLGTKKIVNAILTHKPDIVLSNWNSATMTTNIWKHVNIPVFWINHVTAGSIAVMSHMAIMDEYEKRQPYMGFVSNVQIQSYRDRLIKHFPTCKLEQTVLVRPSFCGNATICTDVDREYDMCTIGRMCRGKDPFFLAKMMEGTESKNVIYSTKNIAVEKDEEYFKKNEKYHHLITYDLDHKEIMKQLNLFRAYVSTCPTESWGITALESLEHGLPLLIKARKGVHASTEIATSPEHYRLITGKTKTDEIMTYLGEFDQLDRQKIIQETRTVHSLENWKTDLIHNLQTAMKTYKG
jgi:hypothetical protein